MFRCRLKIKLIKLLFTVRAFKTRKYLAAADWNFHLDLPHATNKSGHEVTTRKYSQWTQQWDLRTVKQDKGYDYIPLLIARIFRALIGDTDLVTRNISLNASDPRLLAPTIAAKPPPSSKELLKRRSRFSLPSKEGIENPPPTVPSTSKEPELGEDDNPSPMEHWHL